ANITNIDNGASAADSTVNILSGTATAGVQTLNLGVSSYGKFLNFGTGSGAHGISIGGTGANPILIGDSQAAGVFSIGSAMTTGTINIGSAAGVAGTGLITIGLGTGAQTLNIMTTGTGTKTIQVGATGSQNNIALGSTTAGSTLALNAAAAVTVSNGLTATTGNITATAGGVVVSTAAQGITLPGGQQIIRR